MFQLDKEYLAATLEPFRGSPNAVIAVVNEQGVLVQEAGSLDAGLLALILTHGEAGRGRVSFGGRDYAYTWAEPGLSSLRFASVAPVDELLGRAGRVRAATLLLVGGALVAGLILAYVTTRRNFLPIRTLARRLSPSQHVAGRGRGDELADIALAVDEMSVEQKELHQRLDAFMPVVQANLVNRLLDGRTEGITDADLESCGIRFPAGKAVAAIVMLREPGRTSAALGRMRLSALVSAEIRRHCSSAGRTCHVVEQNPFDYRLVIGTDAGKAADLRPVFADLLAGLTAGGADRFPGAVAAVGDLCEPPWGIARSFAEARKALDCRIAGGDGDVILYSELSDGIRDEFAFDTEGRRRIVALLAAGDDAGVDALLDGLLANPVMQRRMAARGPYALFEMLLHAVREADGLDPHLAQCINFNELAALPDDAERIAFCRETFHRLATASGGRSGAAEGTIAAIVAHVDAGFPDPSLSLTALSQRFGLSPDYISRLFKQRTGANFLDYLNRRRVERARELLGEPHAVIKRVGGAAGFASEVSFRRVFHRYEGMSPGEYRRLALARGGRTPSS
jgi:AraC-like DNA-binding protein